MITYHQLVYEGNVGTFIALDYSTDNHPFIDDASWTIPIPKRDNIYYTCHHAEKKKTNKRAFVKGCALFWDIDGVVSDPPEFDQYGKPIKNPLDKKRFPEYYEAFFSALPELKDKTTIIDSGNGLHFFVLLEEINSYGPITTEDKAKYKKLCTRIDKELKKRNLPGFCDNVFDNARVLRLPNTINAKPGREEKPCLVVLSRTESFPGTLDSLLSKEERESLISKPRAAPNKELVIPGAIDTQSVFKECLFMKHCQDNAAILSEPPWYAAIEVCTKLENGRALAHELSKPYSGYNPVEVDTKFDQASKIAGGKRCDYIETIWDGCKNCVYYKKIVSPLQIKHESFVASAKNGFWNIKINPKTGVESFVFCYDDLIKQINIDHTPMFDEISDTLYVHNGIHFKEFLDASVNTYVERKVFIKTADNKICKEFLEKTKRFFNSKDTNMGKPAHSKLNLANGVLNLDLAILEPKMREGKGPIEPHSREYLFTSVMSYGYDPAAECPMFDQFMDDILPDKAVQSYVLDFITYALYNSNIWNDEFMLFYGTGGNGKTQLLRIIMALFGDLALEASYHLLHDKHDRLQLKHKHLYIIEELPRITDKNTWDIVKTMTSGGNITARELYKRGGTFPNTAKIIMSCNNLPLTDGDHSIGMGRRPNIVHFTQSFGQKEGDKEITTSISSKIIASELPGILNLLLSRGERLKAAQFKLEKPEEVVKAVRQFKRDKDIVLAFCEDMVVSKKLVHYYDLGVTFSSLYKSNPTGVGGADSKLWTRGTDLFIAFSEYIESNGSHAKDMMGRNAFYSRLNTIGFSKMHVRAKRLTHKDGSKSYLNVDSENFDGYQVGLLIKPKSEIPDFNKQE